MIHDTDFGKFFLKLHLVTYLLMFIYVYFMV